MTEAPTESTISQTTDASGVDLTLLQWFRSLTPTERVRTLQNYIESIEKLRRANEKR